MTADSNTDSDLFHAETFPPGAAEAAQPNGHDPGGGLTPEQREAEFARLALLSDVNYDLARKAAAERIGIRVAVLDSEVHKFRPAVVEEVVGQGEVFTLADIDPWPDPVEGEALIADVQAALRKHIVLTPEQTLAVALWVFHAHAIAEADHSPRLHISSPVHRCGKSTLLEAISALVPRALNTENISTAALFRLLGRTQKPTMLIDEVDAFLKDNEELRGVLNAGHSPKGTVVRVVGDDHEARMFRVFGAVALAGIREIPTTIEDRSVTITLRRKLPEERTERLRRNKTQLDIIARKIARWVADNVTALSADPPMPEELNDRAQDNWRQMVAIADVLGSTVGENARRAARFLELEKEEDESFGVLALADVFDVFAEKRQDRLTSEYLVGELLTKPERTWKVWRRGEPMTKTSLARLLKPFGIHPKQMKFHGKGVKGYERAPVDEAWRRYCTPPQTPAELQEVDEPPL